MRAWPLDQSRAVVTRESIRSGASPLVVLLWNDDAGRSNAQNFSWLADADHVLVLGQRVTGLDAECISGSIVRIDAVLDQLGKRYSNADLLIFNTRLTAPAGFLDRLAVLRQQPDLPDQVVLPGNYSAADAESIDPLLGLEPVGRDSDIDSMLRVCGDRRWQWIHAAPLHCLLLRAEFWSRHPVGLGRGPVALVDDFYIVDPDAQPQARLSDDYQPVLGHVRLRVSQLVQESVVRLPQSVPSRRTVTLHIAHSWGGGVWRWIEDHIKGDQSGDHLVLVATSDGPGQRCGRQLQLCATGPGRGVIRTYELSPDIISTDQAHHQYREHLQSIINRFGIGRILVSSLIGHSLDCLKTGLPTLQMLHDFYPLWPFLDYDPLPFIDPEQGVEFDRAFERYAASMRLRPNQPEFWRSLGQAWHQSVYEHSVALVAPTQHVIGRWQRMSPSQGLNIRHEPHGFRPFSKSLPEHDEVGPAAHDAKLHLVIPGRLTAGKGLKLLQKALPDLRNYARLTALGCGREGFSLMGQSGIDLIPSYQRDELPALIQALRPDAALLLSTVPETWNYTLSEMRALGVVPVATNLGSFKERIEHGVDGFLVEPHVNSLIRQIKHLAGNRHALQVGVKCSAPERALHEQVEAINALVPARTGTGSVYRELSTLQADRSRMAAELADAKIAVRSSRRALAGSQSELADRTAWAQTMERQFHQRSQWAEQLDKDNQALRVEMQSQRALIQTAEAHRQLLDQTIAERERLEQQLNQIFASRSWRLTRPLRVINRLSSHPVLPRLFNPLNWSELCGKFVHHWRLRGLKQTLWMLQAPPQRQSEPATVVETLIPEPGQIAPPVTFQVVDRPRVSIIIPAHNQLHYTAACLHSLLAADSSACFEVIVVDDASTDKTRRWLKRCRGLQVVTNRKNLGFIGTCNRGVEVATGEFLVFLNNDTKVTDGWLDALVDVFDNDPEVGVAGSRLIYADGSLQEAGGIIFSDGSGWNYGRDQQADRPEYNFVSEADYVSGASLMIRRALFEQLDGFDRHYSPAYYEDTDLCFRAREQGLKVIYQPASTVVHFEGVTSGTDESTGIKKYQAINREKFIQRWQQQLQRQPDQKLRADRRDPVRHLRYHRFAKRALVIDAVIPMPEHDSGSVRMVALLKILSRMGYQTSFMPSNLAWSGADSIRLHQAGIEVLTAPWLNDTEEWLSEHGRDLDVVIVSRHYVLKPLVKLIRYYCPDAYLVFDTVDLHFLREEREAELTASAAARRAAARTRRDELNLIDQSDATLVVSEFEADLLKALKPDARVQIVSNVHALQDQGLRWSERKDLLFVGGFQHPPNVDAANWLIGEILPRIRAELPGVKLHLIGSKMPDSIREQRTPGLVVHGFVADLEPYLNSVRVSLAPLRYGAGVKGKVNQAMSHGLPVVATHCAAEGMYTQHEYDVLMADTTEAFAEEVVRLYQDQALWEKIARNGRDNVERYFSATAAEQALKELFYELE